MTGIVRLCIPGCAIEIRIPNASTNALYTFNHIPGFWPQWLHLLCPHKALP